MPSMKNTTNSGGLQLHVPAFSNLLININYPRVLRVGYGQDGPSNHTLKPEQKITLESC